MNCRGHHRRVDIVKNYDIELRYHMKVFNGMEFKGDAGRLIKDKYFWFDCINKITKKKEMIKCGETAGRDFCALLEIDVPKIYNPLQELSAGYGGGSGSKGDGRIDENPVWIQMHDTAIMFSLWYDFYRNENGHRIAKKILKNLEKDCTVEPELSDIKTLNTLLGQYEITAREIINIFGEKNNMKEFCFDLLIERLPKDNVVQNFESERKI